MPKEFYCYVLCDPRRPGNYRYAKDVRFACEPFYVGKGKGGRSQSHVREAQRSTANNQKVNKIKKILAAGLEPIVVETSNRYTERQAFKREKELIALIGRTDTDDGPLTNANDGGLGGTGGHTLPYFSKEHRRKLGEAFSKALKGRPKSEAHRAAIGAAHKGRVKSAEHRRKISEGSKNRPPISDETRAKIAASTRARNLARGALSEEHKQSIRETKRANRKKAPVLTCPHCDYQNNFKPNMVRHHFDNCKHK